MTQMQDLTGDQVDGRKRLPDQLIIQIFGNRSADNSFLLPARKQLFHNLYHEGKKRCPDQRHNHVKSGVRVCNLPGNNIHLVSLWGKHLDQSGVRSYEPDKEQASADIKDAVRQSGSFGIFVLRQTRKNRCDGGTDIVAKKDRDSS